MYKLAEKFFSLRRSMGIKRDIGKTRKMNKVDKLLFFNTTPVYMEKRSLT